MSLLSETTSTVIAAANVNFQNKIPLQLSGAISVAKAVYEVTPGVGVRDEVVDITLSAPIPAQAMIVKVIVDTTEVFTSYPGVAQLGLGFNEPNDYLDVGVDSVPWGYLYNYVGYNNPLVAESILTSVKFLATNASLTSGKTTIYVLFM